MKFDRFMDKAFKALCIITACFIFAGSVVSCLHPVKAFAISAGDAIAIGEGLPDTIQYYYKRASFQIQEVSQAVTSDMQNGNLDQSTQLGQHVIACYALQNYLFGFGGSMTGSPQWLLGQASLAAYETYYHTYGEDYFEHLPDSLPISCIGTTGFYYGNDILYPVTIYDYPDSGYKDSLNYTFVTSPEFQVIINFDKVGSHEIAWLNQYKAIYSWYANDKVHVSFSGTPYINPLDGEFYTEPYYCYCKFGDNIPHYYSSSKSALTDYTQGSLTFGGSGVSSSLPSNSIIDKETPWLYYNNVLLPYMRENYPDVPDRYYVFPDGYQPPVDPPASFNPNVNFNGVGVGGLGGIIAGAGAIINVGGVGTVNVFAPIQGQIRIDGVQLQFPIDLPDSVYVNRNQVSIPTVDPLEIAGHVLDMISNTHFTFDGVDFTINADGTISISGTSYTLPIGTPTQPDTTPYEYMYEIPTMEHIELIEPTIEPVGLSSFKDGITGFYGLGARLYYDLGLFRPLLICLGLAGVGYAISRIGGH